MQTNCKQLRKIRKELVRNYNWHLRDNLADTIIFLKRRRHYSNDKVVKANCTVLIERLTSND